MKRRSPNEDLQSSQRGPMVLSRDTTPKAWQSFGSGRRPGLRRCGAPIATSEFSPAAPAHNFEDGR